MGTAWSGSKGWYMLELQLEAVLAVVWVLVLVAEVAAEPARNKTSL